MGRVKDPVTGTERQEQAGKCNTAFVISVRQLKKQERKKKDDRFQLFCLSMQEVVAFTLSR